MPSEHTTPQTQTLVALDYMASKMRIVAMTDETSDIKTFRLEELIAQPRPILNDLCSFVGVEADSDFVDACSDKLFAKPRQSQKGVDWPIALVRSVYQQMEDYPFLHGYEFQGRSLGRAA